MIRARGLQARQGSRNLPAPYVKVYLVSGKKCIAKAKTSTARRTLDPLYQQTLTFRENFKGCILQASCSLHLISISSALTMFIQIPRHGKSTCIYDFYMFISKSKFGTLKTMCYFCGAQNIGTQFANFNVIQVLL